MDPRVRITPLHQVQRAVYVQGLIIAGIVIMREADSLAPPAPGGVPPSCATPGNCSFGATALAVFKARNERLHTGYY